MVNADLSGKLILITGAARRIGRLLALACAQAGANIIIHHGHSPVEAETLKKAINQLGSAAEVVQLDLNDISHVSALIQKSMAIGQIYALVNSAAIFSPLSVETTSLEHWERHLHINLTAPFLLSQAFAKQLPETETAHIVNILDWRALRPSADHFPYTISKAALAALTRSMAVAFAPNICVNGLALGAILPPSDRKVNPDLLAPVPAGRWAKNGELESAILFLLTQTGYITGEIIHVDGGRHLI